MAKIAVKNLKGGKAGEIKLNPDVFGLEANEILISQVYVALHANMRGATAHTKTRSERAGSGIKPWRQKGTGRARTGSVRNPIWRKGGVTFGPSNERNFKKKINAKEKNAATRMVLSGKAKSKELVIVENYKLEKGKTKEMAEALKKLGIDKKALLVFSPKEKEAVRTSRNIKSVSNTGTGSLNIFNMLNNKYLVISKDGIKEIEGLLLKKKEKK